MWSARFGGNVPPGRRGLFPISRSRRGVALSYAYEVSLFPALEPVAPEPMLFCRQLTQYILQNSAVLEVFNLLQRIDADSRRENFRVAAGISGTNSD